MVASPSVTLVAFARSVVVPVATPVTVTVSEVAPAGKNTVAGTVAFDVSSTLRFAVKPPVAAGADRFKSRFAVLKVRTDLEVGEKVSVRVTLTLRVSGAKPEAVPVTVVVPKAMPVI